MAFTASDGVTKLSWNDASETLKSDINNSILFNVKLGSAVPQSGSLDINIWFHGSQTSRDANWTNTSAHIFWDDFESGTTLWSQASGTWTTASQQVPIRKGGPNGWSRSPLIVKSGSKYYLYTDSSMDWGKFSTYGGSSWIWYGPWTGWDISISTSLTDFFYEHHWPFDDRPDDIRRGYFNATQIYMTSIVQDGNGTYWATYIGASGSTYVGDVYLASSTDLITWTPSANNPIIRSGGSNPPNTGHIVGSGYLFWDATKTRWIIYSLPICSSPYDKTNGTVYAWIRNNASPDGPFTYYGIVRPNTAGYVEEPCVVYDGSAYYMFYGDQEASGGGLIQRIRYATSTTPLGTFIDQGVVALNIYDWDYALAGMPKLWKDTNDGNWYMVYCGQPQSANLVSDTTLFDNFIGYAKATSFPKIWAAQNVHKMYKTTSAGIAIVSGGSYSNASIYSSILQRYQSTETGLVVRYKNSSNYYRVVFSRSDNTLKLYKVINGTPTVLSSVGLPWTLPTAGTSYPLQVCCYGTRIVAKVSQYGTYWYTLINTTDNSLTDSTWNMGTMMLRAGHILMMWQ